MKNPLINKRTFITMFCLVVMYLTLVIYLFYLQIINGIKYKFLANNNNCKIRYIFSPRGVIYDRYHKEIVINKLSFRLVLMVKKNKTLKELIGEISDIFQINIKDIEKNINKNYFTIIKKFKDLNEVNAWKYNNQLNENIFFEEYWCRENIYEAFNHITGYMKYDINNEISIKGLEKIYNNTLEGKKVSHKIYLDTHKNIIEDIKRDNYEKGKDLFTTFHLKAQLYGEKLFNGYRGSIIVMNKEGEVLVAYSSPHLKVYEENIKDNNYFNKIFQGKYPPGSIFKVISIMTLFTTNEFTPICCSGSIYIGNRKFHCWKRTGHGSVNSIEDAFKKSCNIFFYVNCSNLKNYMKYFFLYLKEFGFEEKTQDIFPEEIKATMKRPEKKSEMMMMSIGQGFANSTLIQNCKLVASLMTGNKITPNFIKSNKNISKNEFTKLNVDDDVLKKVQKAICSTFEEGGNCYHLKKDKYDFFGKTGTAQVMSLKGGKNFSGYKKEHALFTGGELKSGLFVSALVENAGFGVGTAGVFSTKLLEFIIENMDKKE